MRVPCCGAATAARCCCRQLCSFEGQQVAHRQCAPLQVVDDILDITQTTEQLGKTAGKDLASSKTTYPSILGLDQVPARLLV
jgi:Polyprenyl synthetase